MECKSKDFSLHEEGIESLAPDLLQKAAERYAAVFLSAEMSKVVILISFYNAVTGKLGVCLIPAPE